MGIIRIGLKLAHAFIREQCPFGASSCIRLRKYLVASRVVPHVGRIGVRRILIAHYSFPCTVEHAFFVVLLYARPFAHLFLSDLTVCAQNYFSNPFLSRPGQAVLPYGVFQMYYLISTGGSHVIVLIRFLVFCAPLAGLPAKDTFDKTL
jgi:hypothetical protein